MGLKSNFKRQRLLHFRRLPGLEGWTSPQAQLSPFSPLADDWVGIVDDDDSFRRSVARVLRINGFTVETFPSAELYLDRPQGVPPACLVVDIHLGHLSGLELRDQLVAQGRAPPIVFVTGHDEIPVEQIASPFVPCDLLHKPFDSDALLELVSGHLRRQTIRQRTHDSF